MATTDSEGSPSIPVGDWQDTRDTLHLYTQVVGKVRLANERRDRPASSLDLVPRSVADFYASTMSLLGELGVDADIWPMPVEIPDAIAFPDDRVHASYDANAVRRFWLALVEIERVLKVFRARFVGKSSPVHLFWGSLDVALTRFSGRTAPPTLAPNCGPHVMWKAYSHEVSSCGYWRGRRERRACSTPTPTLSHRATATHRSGRKAHVGTMASGSSSFRTSSSAPRDYLFFEVDGAPPSPSHP